MYFYFKSRNWKRFPSFMWSILHQLDTLADTVDILVLRIMVVNVVRFLYCPSPCLIVKYNSWSRITHFL